MHNILIDETRERGQGNEEGASSRVGHCDCRSLAYRQESDEELTKSMGWTAIEKERKWPIEHVLTYRRVPYSIPKVSSANAQLAKRISCSSATIVEPYQSILKSKTNLSRFHTTCSYPNTFLHQSSSDIAAGTHVHLYPLGYPDTLYLTNTTDEDNCFINLFHLMLMNVCKCVPLERATDKMHQQSNFFQSVLNAY